MKKTLYFLLVIYMISALNSCASRRDYRISDAGGRFPHDSDEPKSKDKEPKQKKVKKQKGDQ